MPTCSKSTLAYIMFTKIPIYFYKKLSTTKHYFTLHVCINSVTMISHHFARVSVGRSKCQLPYASFSVILITDGRSGTSYSGSFISMSVSFFMVSNEASFPAKMATEMVPQYRTWVKNLAGIKFGGLLHMAVYK